MESKVLLGLQPVHDERLLDLGEAASGCLEVYERGLPTAVSRLLLAEAPRVREGLDALGAKRRWDCGYAVAAWKRELQGANVVFAEAGGVGVDEPAEDAFYRTIPLSRRSGYLEGDGQVHRHWWLLIGPGRHLFDPTAHQFDNRGGVSLDRYIVDGMPIRQVPD